MPKSILLATSLSALLLAGCVTQTTPENTAPPAATATLSLADRVAAFRQENPRVMTRDAARRLGVSEADLLTLNIGSTVTRLRDGGDTGRAILGRLHELGRVTSVTRNDEVTLEVTGTANAPRVRPGTDGRPDRTIPGYFGGPIDLRPFFDKWQYAFAVVAPGREGRTRRSFQFFDAHGTAVQKLYLEDEAAIPVFERIVAELRAAHQSPELAVTPLPAATRAKPDAEIDTAGFLAAWDEMTDVHQFGGILREFGVTRQQALRLAGAERAYRVASPAALRAFLETAAANGTEFLAFVGNNGLTQVFTGSIQKTGASGPWFNVLDPDFNLHVREDLLGEIWVVKKPSGQDLLTAVEVYNHAGDIVVQFYSRRAARQPESATWRALLSGLPAL